jgi:hypothetical protein
VTSRKSILAAIVLGGLVAGTLDIGAAMLISGRSMAFILQFIASGVLGPASFDGGTGTVLLGALLQWAMSLVIAAIFVLASLKLPVLRRRWVSSGLAFGVATYFIMTYVVVPLSAVGGGWHFSLMPFLKNLAAMLVFGLIVAAFARLYLKPPL